MYPKQKVETIKEHRFTTTQYAYLTKKGERCKREVNVYFTSHGQGETPPYCWQHIPNIDSPPQWGVDPQRRDTLPLCRRITNLSGPSHVFFYPNVLGRKILILGESHHNKGLCQPKTDMYEVHQWLYDLCLQAPECVDLFIEQPYMRLDKEELKRPSYLKSGDHYHNQLKNYTCPLLAITNTFQICYNFNKTACQEQFTHLRYHYSDSRQVRDQESSWISPISLWLTQKPELTKFYDPTFDHMREIIYEYLLTMNDTHESKQVYESYLSVVSTYLYGSIDPYMSKKSRYDTYLSKYFMIIKKELGKLDKTINKERFLGSLKQTYMNDLPKDLINHLIVLQQDLYLLIRVFITFDSTKLKRGPLNCRDPQPKNIIIYTGSSHSFNYYSFLKIFANTDPSIVLDAPKNESQCVSFPEPFDFFRGT